MTAMTAPPPDGMYITDEMLRREGYRTHPFSDDGQYVGSPKVRDASRHPSVPSACASSSPDDIPASPLATRPPSLPSGPSRPSLTRVVPSPSPLPPAAQPRDERERLGLLRRQLLLDSTPDSTLDALVQMCAAQFDVPVCLVSLVDDARQWFKANHGLPAEQTPRRESFCAWLLLPKDPKVLLVRDASADPRFANNPLVVGAPGIRFYAGVPLVVHGRKLGSLCLIDYVPHTDPNFFGEAETRRLMSVAKVVSGELAKPPADAWMRAAVETIREGVVLLDVTGAGAVGHDEEDTTRDEHPTEPSNAFDVSSGPSDTDSMDADDGPIDDDATANPRTGTRRRDGSNRRYDVRARESVIFVNAALRRAFGPRVAEEDLFGLDLVELLPGPAETTAKLRRASADLAREANRRRSSESDRCGDGRDDRNVPGSPLSRSRSHSRSRSLLADEDARMTRLDSLSRLIDEAGTSEDEEDDERRCLRLELDVDLHEGRRRLVLAFSHMPSNVVGRDVVLMNVRDVTREHESRRLLRAAKERSDAAVVAKSAFLANTSHEIRTPLNAIIAGSELLSEIPGMTPDQAELNDMVVRASKTLLSIVNDVLDFSKIEAEKVTLEDRPFVVESCVDLSLEMQSIKANAKRLVLNYVVDDSVPWRLVGDEMRLRQVVTNLISNAVKFTARGSVQLRVRALAPGEDPRAALRGGGGGGGGGGGASAPGASKRSRGGSAEDPSEDERGDADDSTVAAAAAVRRGGSRTSGLSLKAPRTGRRSVGSNVRAFGGSDAGSSYHGSEAGGAAEDDARVAGGSDAAADDDDLVTLLFEVVDTGAGISAKDQAKLFTSFTQVNATRTRREGGTGLGLAISMRLVRLMGGDMAVRSEGPGRGSTFAFTVRCRRGDPPRFADEVARHAPSPAAPLPVAGPLRGRRVLVVSTCESFAGAAHFLLSGSGLEATFLDAEGAARLLDGPDGWGDAVAALVDREFIPREAVDPFVEKAGEGGEGGGVGGGERGASAAAVPAAGSSVLASSTARDDGEDDDAATVAADAPYHDACNEYIHALHSAVERHADVRPMSAMVMTFSSPCVLSRLVALCAKPLIHRHFSRWVRDLAETHGDDPANEAANARWENEHLDVDGSNPDDDAAARHRDARGDDAATMDVASTRNADAGMGPGGVAAFRRRSGERSLGAGAGGGAGGGSSSGLSKLKRRGSLVNLAATESEADRFALMDLDADAKARVRVLMAEDNLINQKVAKKILQALGFNPKVVGDGSQALAAYVESVDADEPFDLILMDLQMPVMDGVEATRAIIEHAAGRLELGLPPPRVVALTADVASSVVRECKACGMYGFLSKPVERENILRVMEDAAAWVAGGREPKYDPHALWNRLQQFN